MKKQQQIIWRRQKILDLCIEGYCETEIANLLRINVSTISRDIRHLKQTSIQRTDEYADYVSFEEQKIKMGIDRLLKKLWEMIYELEKAEQEEKIKQKVQVASLILSCYIKKTDLQKNLPLIYEIKRYRSNVKVMEDKLKEQQRRMEFEDDSLEDNRLEDASININRVF